MRTLANNLRVAVASPTYLAQHGAPERPEDLEQHNCIVGFKSGVVPESHWPLLDGGRVAVSGSFITNEMALRFEAAKSHLGIAMVIDYMAAEELKSGELVAVLPELLGKRDRASLVYLERAFLDPKIRVFVDFFSARMAEERKVRKSLRSSSGHPSGALTE